MCCACDCTPLAWSAPPRKTAETPPCMALPRHAAGSSTGRRSSPGGRRSWGRGRDRPVCRSLCARTWGTLFSCLQPSTMRRDPLHITHTGRHGSCGSCHPAHACSCARVATCLPGSRTHAVATTPRSSGTKICTKCKPLTFAYIDENDPRLNNASWNGRGRIQNKPHMPGGFHQTR